jgi:hypothetical protein
LIIDIILTKISEYKKPFTTVLFNGDFHWYS